MPGPYSIAIRGSMITARPLTNVLQPMHPTSRFLWVGQRPYVPPTWYPNQPGTANAMANRAKTLAGRNIRDPQRRV
jgi:hypothetical protein